MSRPRTSTAVLMAVFMTALVTYFLVRPPAPDPVVRVPLVPSPLPTPERDQQEQPAAPTASPTPEPTSPDPSLPTPTTSPTGLPDVLPEPAVTPLPPVSPGSTEPSPP